MPRSIWNGTITFGMVNVPIKLYSATESKSIHFHEVHAKDGARVQHRRICPRDEREVPSKEIVSGYEVAPDKYVVLEKDEIKAAAGNRGKVVHIEEFVDANEIDPIFYEKTYYVGSRDDKNSYRLLHEALKRSGRVGIGRFSFHDREYLIALRALDEVMGLHTLRFHDEIASGKDLEAGGRARRPSKAEIQMANQLVDSLAEEFDPSNYDDTYREAVLDLVRRESAGKEIDLLQDEEPEQGDDLAAALQASLGKSDGRRSKRGSSRRSRKPARSKARS